MESQTIIKASNQEMTLIVFHGRFMKGTLFRDFQTGTAKLVVPCPRCSRLLEIPREKEVLVQDITPPKHIRTSTGTIELSNRVTVRRPYGCAHPAVNGKGKCGFRATITDGVMSQV